MDVPFQHCELKLCDIVHVLRELQPKWFNLGVSFEMTTDVLDSIKSENDTNDRRLMRVVDWWLKNTSDADRRWSTLADKVAKISGHSALVDKLRKREHATDQVRRKRPATHGDSDDELQAGAKYGKPCVKIEGPRTDATSLVESTAGTDFEAEAWVKERFNLEYVKRMKFLQDLGHDEISHPVLIYFCKCGHPCSSTKCCVGECPKFIKRKVYVVASSLKQEVPQNVASAVVKMDFFHHEKLARDMQVLYGAFYSNTFASFKRIVNSGKVEIEELTIFLSTSFPTSMLLKKKELDSAKCVKDVFYEVLPREWYNYGELESLINYYGHSSDRDRLELYKKCIQEYFDKTRMKEIVIVDGDPPQEGEQVIVKFDGDKPFCEPDKISGVIMFKCQIFSVNVSAERTSS